MKFFVALTLLVSTASAGLVPNPSNLRENLPRIPLVPLAELESRITNGKLAAVGELPYQVGLRVVFAQKHYWCGGILISSYWVVSAAHCVYRADNVTVYLGATDLYDINENGQQRLNSVKADIIVNKGWDPVTVAHDIALIKLPSPIDFTDNIQPATLPKKTETHLYSTYEGETAVASGWGRISDSAPTVTQFLRYIEVPVMKQSDCAEYYPGVITSNMICISTNGGKSTCNGDSGGPLVYRDGETNYLIGATSFGSSWGCEWGFPGVFTRITAYLDWIEGKTGVVNA